MYIHVVVVRGDGQVESEIVGRVRVGRGDVEVVEQGRGDVDCGEGEGGERVRGSCGEGERGCRGCQWIRKNFLR